MTDKQARFVEEYCVDFNATQAAIRAGYSAKTARSQGARLLTNVDIRRAIETRLDELSMSAAEATKRMSDWGRGSFEPFLTEDGGLDLASKEARAAVGLLKKVKVTEKTYGDDVEVHERRVEIEIHDAKDATKTLLQVRGKLNQKVDVNVNAGVAFTADDLAAAQAEMEAFDLDGDASPEDDA